MSDKEPNCKDLDKIVELLEKQNEQLELQRSSNYVLSAAIVAFAFIQVARSMGYLDNEVLVAVFMVIILMLAIYGPHLMESNILDV